MDKAKAKEALCELNLTKWKTTASRREEDQTRLVKYSSRSSRPNQKHYGLSGRKARIILLAIIAILALVIGLAVGLTKKHSTDDRNKYKGTLTYYDPSLTSSTCGPTYSVFDNVTMISPTIFDTDLTAENRSISPFCGHELQATRNGHSINLTVVDGCDGGDDCGSSDLVVSLGAFDVLVADPNQDEASVTWHWLPPFAST